MSEKLLELINVTKIFKSKEQKRKIYGLDNINISILEGEVVGVLGRPGAGKSTLLKILGDKVKPSSGNINVNEDCELEIVYIDGEEVNGDENIIKSLLAKIGDIYILDNIFQDFDKKDKDFFKIKLEALINGGKTIIISDSSIDFLKEICNSAIWVENGKVRMHDTYLRVSEGYVNFEKRYEEMTDEEREELEDEWESLRFVDGDFSEEVIEKKFKAPKIHRKNNNTKDLIKYGTAAIGVTLVLAGGFILYNKMNDNRVVAEEKPQVVAPKPDVVIEKVKYEKDMTFAFVMTSKFDNRNLGLREYLEEKTGDIIESISIVTLKEDGFEVELQDLSPYVQVNFPSKKLNDQLRYSLLAESEGFLKEKLEKYSGKTIDGITVVDKAIVSSGLKSGGVKFTGIDGSVTIDGNVVKLDTIEGKGSAVVQILKKLSLNDDLSSLGIKGDGVTFKKYKEILKVQDEFIKGNKEAEKKLTEAHIEYLKAENKVGLKVEAKEVETRSIDLKSLLAGVRNIPAEYLTSRLVFVEELDNSKNIIVQEIKKNATQNNTNINNNNNNNNRPSTGGGTSGGSASGGAGGSTGGNGNQGGSGSGGATDGGTSGGGQTGGGSGSGGNTGSGGDTGSGGSGDGTEGGQTGGDGNQEGSESGSGEGVAE